MLVTRDIFHASMFALDDEEGGGRGRGGTIIFMYCSLRVESNVLCPSF